MAAGGGGQKKVICEHSSNEVSLATAFVQTLTMASVIWIPLRRAKWPPIVRGEHAGSETSLSPHCSYSNYDDNAFFFFRISARLLTLLKGFGIGLDLGRHAGRCWDFRQVSKIKAKKMSALYWFFYRMMLFHKTEFCTVVMMSLHVVMYSNWFINNNIWAFKWSKAYKVV